MTIRNKLEGRILPDADVIEQAAIVQASEKSGKYSGTSFSLANASSDVSLASTLDTGFFTPLEGNVANYIEIRTTQEISVKFRTKHNTDIADGSLDSVKLVANALRLLGMIADCTDILFTNSSGSSATVDIVAI